jgi:single-stranded-DNA-specific exonuclease
MTPLFFYTCTNMLKRWIAKPTPDPEVVKTLGHQLNLNPTLTAILVQRGVDTFEKAKNFFRPALTDLHDPFLMKDMDKAVDRLHRAILGNEKILIYGDYDVDGTTAVALVFRYLQGFYPSCEYYVPNRYSEGYGVSQEGIDYAVANQFRLIITLDCGIKASDKVQFANLHQIDFIICDHHLPDADIPNAVAVLDPKREDCTYPYSELSGCGLGFKLIQAYAQKHRTESDVFDYLDLVAVSIASDIVPITGENRVLAEFGLKKLNENPSPGLKALKEIAATKNDLDISGVVFTLGPRINAAGRIAHANGAVKLLIAQSEEVAMNLAFAINETNDQRRVVDVDITTEALAMIESDEKLRSANTTVLYKSTWSKGVIGIVASRCIERYYRPTIILTESNNKITGSARSVNGFDLYKAIEACGDLLDQFGGHRHAAGLTLEAKNLDAFRQRFEEIVTERMTDEMRSPVIDIDAPLVLDAINHKFLNILKQMAPFGPENLNPVFSTENLTVAHSLSSFKDRHVRFFVRQQNCQQVLSVVGFDLGRYYEQLLAGQVFKMAFTVEENSYNGTVSIQLRAKDLCFD